MIRVPAGVERTGVIQSALDQLRVIAEIVAPLGVGANDALPPEGDPPGEQG